jgi:DNA-binding response OmpR family regulator
MTASFAGKRVLIVEDEYFIASELKVLLESRDAAVLGPVAHLEAAIALIDDGPIDAAILDINIEGDFSFPVVDRLIDRAVPVMFITGYDHWSIPPAYRDMPRLTKPFANTALIALLQRALTAATP